MPPQVFKNCRLKRPASDSDQTPVWPTGTHPTCRANTYSRRTSALAAPTGLECLELVGGHQAPAEALADRPIADFDLLEPSASFGLRTQTLLTTRISPGSFCQFPITPRSITTSLRRSELTGLQLRAATLKRNRFEVAGQMQGKI